MRKFLFHFAIAVKVILSVSQLAYGGERPASAPPIDERLTGIESRVNGHDTEIAELSRKIDALKLAIRCPCPRGGVCICGEDCVCPNCPKHSKPELRTAYEREVLALAKQREELKSQGLDTESIARKLHAARREIGVKYKNLTSEDLRAKIYDRNQKVYGDPLGPTLDFLRGQGKTWEEIAESAGDPGDWPPKELSAAKISSGHWKGTQPTNKGVELLFFGASWCTACPPAEARLGSAKSEIFYIDCTNSNPIAERYGINGFPYLLQIKDGKFMEGRAGDAVHEVAARDWLNGRTLTAGAGANTVGGKPSAPAATSRTYSAPRMTVTRGNGPGHTHRCSYCGTSWSHENWNVGSPSAHTCPNCRRITYGNRTEGWNAPYQTRSLPASYQFQPRVQFASGYSYGTCPNCPR